MNIATEKILSERRDLPWLPPQGVCHCIATTQRPPREQTSSAFVLCFNAKQELLMIIHERRGSDIPGGHLEGIETPEQGAARELLEEANVAVGNLQQIAVMRVTIEGPKPEGYKYPFPKSYMVAFVGLVEREDPFEARFETTAREFLPPEQARRTTWVQENRALYELALSRLPQKT